MKATFQERQLFYHVLRSHLCYGIEKFSSGESVCKSSYQIPLVFGILVKML